MEQEELIKVDSLALSYENMTVIKDLSFAVNSGDYLCIVGENGSGKSTLVKSLLSLKKPVGGTISFGGGLRRSEIGYMPQQTGAQQDFPASVWEVVLSGCLNSMGLRPFYTDRERKLAAENMERLGITNLKKRCYRELSGGQQQRVLLARALCAAGELLILDEPVTGLDPAAAQELYRTLEYLNKQEGIAIVAVTHDIRSALRYADHILHAGHGTYFFGTAADYLTSPWGKRFGGDEA